MSLQNKVTIVTGGGKNLGALIAEQFAAAGAHVAIHYNSASTKTSAEQVAAKLSESGVKAQVYQADLTKTAAVKGLFDAVQKDLGTPDIVVNTVGKVLKKPLVEISEEEYDEMFNVNSRAAFFITQEAAKRVKEGGKIINIVTSLLAAYTPFYSSYQGSKAPVEWFTKGLSKELMAKGISVNAVAPGPMDTPFFYGQETPEAVAFHKSNAIDGRLTKVEDIAPIVKFLCTEGSWINGQTIFANGGYTSR
ncbi:hypothetical protein DV737_g4429, partial [Chaetothyriales sp. CBS 132003]